MVTIASLIRQAQNFDNDLDRLARRTKNDGARDWIVSARRHNAELIYDLETAQDAMEDR